MLIIFISSLFYLIIHPRFVNSDDFEYAKTAFNIFNGKYEFNPIHFYNRFGVFIPTGILYMLFGINEFTTTAWPFLIYILLIIFSYYFLQKNIDKNTALLSAFFIAFNFSILNWALELAPDLIMTFFATMAIFFLYEIRKGKKNSLLSSFLFVSFLFISFLTKENIITLIPFLLIVCIYDLFIKKQNIKFWIISIIFGSILLAGYFLFYQIMTGNFYYRFAGIESGHNLNDSSYVGKPHLLIQRLLYLPVIMFTDNIYYFLLILFAAPLIFKTLMKKQSIDTFNGFWSFYSLFLFLSFWFMSTSLKHYNPFNHRQDRTWMLIIVPFTILAAMNLYDFFKENEYKSLIKKSIYYLSGFIIALIITVIFGKFAKKFPYGCCLFCS